MAMPSLLYHEVQESRLCAVHCVNAVLQGPYFSEVDLATMAQELDAQEQQVMLESGAGSTHYLNYMAEGSSNVDADGNFSIQVLNRALQIWNLQCVPLEAPEAVDARSDPQKQSAFICHLQVNGSVSLCIGNVATGFHFLQSLHVELLNLLNIIQYRKSVTPYLLAEATSYSVYCEHYMYHIPQKSAVQNID